MTSPLPEQDDRTAEIVASVAALMLISQDEDELRPRIARLFAPLRLNREAIIAAVHVALIRPVTTIPEKAKYASATTRESEFFFRATFMLQSAIRIHNGLREGRSKFDLERKERKYYQQHLEIQSKRASAARAADRLVARHGNILGWYTVLDNRTSPECKQAHGKNFDVTRRPSIGFPGSVHPSCRCKPGPPHRGAGTVYAIRHRLARKAA